MWREKSGFVILGRRAFILPFVLIAFVAAFSFGQEDVTKTPAIALGVAQIDITPTKPVLMSGYEVQVTRLMPGAEGPLTRKFLELIRSF